jgi:hypothetical protein
MKRRVLAAWLALLVCCGTAHAGLLDSPVPESSARTVALPEHRRGTEQTFLTFPEWFLVFSPAEYATYVRDHSPTDFPFIGHIRHFWQSYAAVSRAASDGYPFNFGYHVMIMVIGTSTTVEYLVRSAYETVIGRVFDLTARHGLTDEERFGAVVAQDYVDFIRVTPWYEYPFFDKLAALWREMSWFGPDLLRKWERKYILTTEYAAKGAYGWLIKKATKASYEEPLRVTAVVLDRTPWTDPVALPELKVLKPLPQGEVLATIPRYHDFMRYADALAARGVGFVEIAGNRSVILVSAIAPEGWQPRLPRSRTLFAQPILTQPGRRRVAMVVPVDALSRALDILRGDHVELEHVFDY